MLRAAAGPCSSALAQCSTRIDWPTAGCAARATSPAANTLGELVRRLASVRIPSSTDNPARSASPVRGNTPTPTTTKAQSMVLPSTVRTMDGKTIGCDFVVGGVGVLPRTGLAERAGL